MGSRLSGIRSWPEIAVGVGVVVLALAGGGYFGVALGIGTILVWLLVLVALLRGRMRAVPGPLASACLCLIALAGLTAFSLAWAGDDGAGFIDAVRVAGYAGTFALAGLTLRFERMEALLTALAAGILVVAVVALGARLGGIGGGDTALVDVLASTSGRLSYPIGYWNALGALMALGVPLFVWLAAEAPSTRPRGWAIAALPPLMLVAYMTSSRGALLAAAFGVAVAAAFASSGRRTIATAAVAGMAALPAVCLARLQDGILDGPGSGEPGLAEIAVVVGLVAGVGMAAWLGPRLAVRLERVPLPRVSLRILIPALVVAAIGLVAYVGPSQFLDDFRAVPKQSEAASREDGTLTFSGSGRAQFWGTALDAFADEPVRGGGAGSYPAYWNAHGTLDTPTQNAHSEPLELMAELGVGGVALFLAFFALIVAAGIRRRGSPDAPAAGAALGVLAAASVGFLIDWTWQIPAVVVPVLVSAAVLAGSPAPASRKPRYRTALGGWSPAPMLTAGLVLLALPALWAGGVLALATGRLDAAGEALDRGDYAEAAQAARAAAAIEPWAAEPWVQLATIEQATGNLEAARIDVHEAIDRTPDDFRPWLLAAAIDLRDGRTESGSGYALRALQLAPRVLERVALTPGGRADNGL